LVPSNCYEMHRRFCTAKNKKVKKAIKSTTVNSKLIPESNQYTHRNYANSDNAQIGAVCV